MRFQQFPVMLHVHVVSIHQAVLVSMSFQTIQEGEIQHVGMQRQEELKLINFNQFLIA